MRVIFINLEELCLWGRRLLPWKLKQQKICLPCWNILKLQLIFSQKIRCRDLEQLYKESKEIKLLKNFTRKSRLRLPHIDKKIFKVRNLLEFRAQINKISTSTLALIFISPFINLNFYLDLHHFLVFKVQKL